MVIKVFDSELNYLGVIDNFNSFTYVSKYNDIGTFKIKGLLTQQSKDLLKIGNYIFYDGRAGFIHSIEIDIDGNSEQIVVNGYSLLAILQRRIIWGTINFTGKLDDFIYKIINENCIEIDVPRKIPFLSIDASQAIEQQLEKQVSYKNLLDTIIEVVSLYDLGIRIDFDIENKKFVFSIYNGENRTLGTENPLIFNREFENIVSEVYINSKKQFANTALVGGQDEAENRAFVSIGDENQGLERYEVFVDARDLAKGELTESEYKAQLKQRGNEQLSGYSTIESFEGIVNTISATDYKLGDKVSIVDQELGIILNTRITEIEEIFESKGTTINLTFGTGVPSLLSRMVKY